MRNWLILCILVLIPAWGHAFSMTHQTVKLAVKDPALLIVFQEKEAQWDADKKELTFSVNQMSGQGWCLVWKDVEIIALFETSTKSRTRTIWNLFGGTEAECMVKIEELGLKFSDKMHEYIGDVEAVGGYSPRH